MKIATSFLLIFCIIIAGGCSKTKKEKAAKIRHDFEVRENRKDIEELEASASASFFEPDADAKISTTSYELDTIFNSNKTQKFILQDPRVLEAYPNGDYYDVYFFLGPDVIPRTYSYVFKVDKIRKDDLDLFIALKNDNEGRIFLVLKKLKVSWVPQTELETTKISRQVVHAEFVEIKKLSKAKVIAEKMKIAKMKDQIFKAREEIQKKKDEMEER